MKSQYRDHWKSIGLVRFVRRMGRASAKENWAKIARRLNAWVLGPLLNRRRFRQFHGAHVGDLTGHYYVIVVPGTLHFLLPCLRLVGDSVPIILVANGLRGWEREFLRSEFPQLPQFRLYTVPKSLCAHGDVLNLLFAVTRNNFGILDHDTFVFDRRLLQVSDFRDTEFVQALWCYRNTHNGVPSPRTYQMFFHTELVKKVMRKYRVGMQVYQWIPARLWRVLKAVGYGPENYPKDYLRGFDATNLVSALCLVEGYEPRCLEAEPAAAIHLGGTSYQTDLYQAYIALRFLEWSGRPELTSKYLVRFTPFERASDVLSRLPAEQGRPLADWMDGLLARITCHLNATAEVRETGR